MFKNILMSKSVRLLLWPIAIIALYLLLQFLASRLPVNILSFALALVLTLIIVRFALAVRVWHQGGGFDLIKLQKQFR